MYAELFYNTGRAFNPAIFSARYGDENILLNEAKEVFENTYLTAEMKVFDV